MRGFALTLALALPFAPAAAQELADADAERAHVAWAEAIAATLEGGTPREALVAVWFGQTAARRGARVAQARVERAWSRAVAESPDDPLVHWLAVTACPFGSGRCDAPASLRRLVELEPDNGAVWHVVLNQARADHDPVLARDALARLARAERYDTHLTGFMRVLDDALATIPVPDALRRFGDAPVDDATARGIAVFGVLLALPQPDAGPLIGYCAPDVDAGYEARRADCVAAGERIATRSDQALHRWIGTRVWLRAARGTPHEARARQAALDHEWQRERFAGIGGADPDVEAARRELERRRRHGSELAAMAEALAEAGVPLQAPPDFVPQNPID